jgi:hypothetical protein
MMPMFRVFSSGNFLECLDDGLWKGDRVDVVGGILLEKRPELLARRFVLTEEEVGGAQVFPGFEADD